MMKSNPTANIATGEVRQSPWRQWAEVLLIVLVFFIAAGDPTPNVNETHYVCRLKHYWNPQWCQGDLFLESPDTQLVFIWLFGWLTRWFSLSATAWIGRLVAWTLLGWSWQRLSWRLIPYPLAAVLSAALFVVLNNEAHLAGEWIVGGVEAKCFAYVFVLVALREMIDGRWNTVWLVLGAATAFHPIVGGWSGLVCAATWFFKGRREQQLRSMVPSLVGAGLLASVGIVPALSLTWHEPADLVAEAGRIYVFERLPHHLALLTLPSPEVTLRILRHAGLLAALWILTRAIRPSAELRRIAQFAWFAALIACVGFAIELAHPILDYVAGEKHPQFTAKLLRYYWFRLTDFAAPMAVALVATSIIAAQLQRIRVFATSLVVTLAIAMCWARIENPVPPADLKMADYAAWVEVCDWVAKHTPADALFMTPKLNQSFKWRTGRPEVVNRKDIPQDARGIIEWYRRIKDIYYASTGGIEQPLDSIGILGTERVRELAIKYHALYVLIDRGQLLSLPVVHINEEYVVYRIENRSAGNSR